MLTKISLVILAAIAVASGISRVIFVSEDLPVYVTGSETLPNPLMFTNSTKDCY